MTVMPRLLIVLGFIASLAPFPAFALEKLVTVTGEATVAVAPDAAIIRIGVSSEDKTARQASDANSKQMTAVLAAIKSNKIADRDIQTSRLSLQPQYDPNKSGTAHLTGFQATNQVTVRIRDIGRLPSSTARFPRVRMKCQASNLLFPNNRNCLIARATMPLPMLTARPTFMRKRLGPNLAMSLQFRRRVRQCRPARCKPCALALSRFHRASRH